MCFLKTNKNMKIRHLLTVLIPLAGVFAWFVLQQFLGVPAIRHVVLISLDTTRADYLSCYGYPKSTTPNINVC
ncbi:MAG TPA: hypothetical protein EYQ27_11455 [Gemmatimonadetes bacterium]|nr:hypothetical protein [Gemmatimonadota bacterium]